MNLEVTSAQLGKSHGPAVLLVTCLASHMSCTRLRRVRHLDTETAGVAGYLSLFLWSIPVVFLYSVHHVVTYIVTEAPRRYKAYSTLASKVIQNHFHSILFEKAVKKTHSNGPGLGEGLGINRHVVKPSSSPWNCLVSWC